MNEVKFNSAQALSSSQKATFEFLDGIQVFKSGSKERLVLISQVLGQY